jgi:hypothetical protein
MPNREVHGLGYELEDSSEAVMILSSSVMRTTITTLTTIP